MLHLEINDKPVSGVQKWVLSPLIIAAVAVLTMVLLTPAVVYRTGTGRWPSWFACAPNVSR